jgi:hypothetical protein
MRPGLAFHLFFPPRVRAGLPVRRGAEQLVFAVLKAAVVSTPGWKVAIEK